MSYQSQIEALTDDENVFARLPDAYTVDDPDAYYRNVLHDITDDDHGMRPATNDATADLYLVWDTDDRINIHITHSTGDETLFYRDTDALTAWLDLHDLADAYESFGVRTTGDVGTHDVNRDYAAPTLSP